jgi:hypothetical protein
MNLEEVQPFVTATLRAASTLAGVPVLEDTGERQTNGREVALRTKGACVIVWPVESDSVQSVGRDGTLTLDVRIPVTCEEAVAQAANTAQGGLGVPALKLARLVMQAASGRPALRPRGGTANHCLVPADPPFTNFGTVEGVRLVVVFLSLRLVVSPESIS